MNRYLQLCTTLFCAWLFVGNANAQDFDLLLIENFDATTLPAGWVSSVADPADPALGGSSGGWEFGVMSYSGAWTVPMSIDNSGFAISNDDQDPSPFGTDRSDDFLGVGFFDMTPYDSMTILFDRFYDGQYGSEAFLYIDNGVTPIVIPVPANSNWVEDGITITDGQILAGNPWAFTNEVVIGFLHDDNGFWAAGFAVDNVLFAGWLPPCETTGLTQEPSAPVVPLASGTTDISTNQAEGGEFSVITNIQSSTEYTIDHSAGSYVTVRTGSATGPVFETGFTPLTITTLTTEDLYLIWSVDAACDPGITTNHTSTITIGNQVCAAEAGALFALSGADACLGDELVAAESFPEAAVPTGFVQVYVITDGQGNVIDGPFTDPNYTPTAEGTFVIHSMVIDPADQATILAEASNGAQAVANLFEENGGQLCGSLDLNGAGFIVVDCPDNDSCEDAEMLMCGSSVSGSNINSSIDFNGIPQGVWYTFQGNGQDVTFSTCQSTSNFDT